MLKKLLFFILFFSSYAEASLSYTVQYIGIDDTSVVKTLRSSTQLSTLKKRPPDSINAVRYRAESDIPAILNVLHAFGYYEARVEIQVEEGFETAVVIVDIDPGPVYKIEKFRIDIKESKEKNGPPAIELKNIGITLGKSMNAEREVSAELKILQILSECGYPLSSITDRKIVVDGESKTVRINLEVTPGPFSKFGPLTIEGNKRVKPLFFKEKLEWKEGASYNSALVDETQKALVESGLFSSVIITHGQKLDNEKELPMLVEVAESRHRSINIGVSYQTYYGPGITVGWENRNMAGLGQRLSLQGDVTERSHTGLGTYIFPNFGRIGQDYVWQAQAMHQDIIPYSERTYNITNRLEIRTHKKIRMSIGARGERLYVTGSPQNGTYWLIEAPFYFAWNGSNSLLNPTKGLFFQLAANPSMSIQAGKGYIRSVFSAGHYLPLTPKHRFVIAQKLTIGSILSKDEHLIPLSKRLYGGSEEDLRGYAYQSVSPLNSDNQPYGGRSAFFFTLETRFRLSKTIGLVPFFDMGNVYEEILPTFEGRWLKSLGIGVRYFSFMGPFRLDVGFPLEKREDIDNNYRILASIGQTF